MLKIDEDMKKFLRDWLTKHKSLLLLICIYFNPAWMSKYTHYEVGDEITYPFQNFNGEVVEVWNGWIISSHTLLDMW